MGPNQGCPPRFTCIIAGSNVSHLPARPRRSGHAAKSVRRWCFRPRSRRTTSSTLRSWRPWHVRGQGFESRHLATPQLRLFRQRARPQTPVERRVRGVRVGVSENVGDARKWATRIARGQVRARRASIFVHEQFQRS